jgi:hypothetical protein
VRGYELDLTGSKQHEIARFNEYDHEASGFINDREFF